MHKNQLEKCENNTKTTTKKCSKNLGIVKNQQKSVV